jgi:hypothetical protein
MRAEAVDGVRYALDKLTVDRQPYSVTVTEIRDAPVDRGPGDIKLAAAPTFAAARTDSLLADGESHAAALTGGHHLAFAIGAGLLVAAVVVAFTVLHQPKQRPIVQAENDTSATARAAAALLALPPPRAGWKASAPTSPCSGV